MRWADRWADHLQRKSDERAARWLERKRERDRTGKMTLADRYIAHAQRKIDKREARFQELQQLRGVFGGVIAGPGDSACVISVDQTGAYWMSHLGVGVSAGGGGGGGLVGLALLAGMLITELIWWLVFHRTYTIHVHTLDHSPVKVHVRMANVIDAHHAAAEFAIRFQDDGPAALPASTQKRVPGVSKWTPRKEAEYVLGWNLDPSRLGPAVQAEYDQLKRERQAETSGARMSECPEVIDDKTAQPHNYQP